MCMHLLCVVALSVCVCVCLQLRLDGAQVAEQTALRKQLHQEQELLQRFQESQDEKLKSQHNREVAALDVKVDNSKKELNKEVSEGV